MQNQILNMVALGSSIDVKKVKNTVQLLDDGNTIPFIARYRKEMTGGLDEVQIRQVAEQLTFHRSLNERKEDVIRLIEEQGKMTSELQEAVMNAATITRVDDIYRPFRPKKKTRAGTARERGLEPLADYLLSFPLTGILADKAAEFLGNDVNTIEEALKGARDIIAENIADDPSVRGWIRDFTRRRGFISSTARDAEKISVYTMYYDYREEVQKIPAHRILAINRGEREDVLKVKVDVDEVLITKYLEEKFVKQGTLSSEMVREAALDAYKRLIQPSVQRDIRAELTEKGEKQAVIIFSKNLRQLLLQPPVKGKRVLGIDPAFRTGCKLGAVDETGKLLETGVIYPTPPRKQIEEAKRTLNRIISQYDINLIAIGNGTACRETEKFVADFIREHSERSLFYIIVNEAGASVYSASTLAAHEFPQLDVSERSAVSIARRLQDPLAELVKIEPRAIGVGQYQHDINDKVLEEKLAAVVETVVNYVGVDLNTASPSLLSYAAGINMPVAENIVKFRESQGEFRQRQDLLKVPRLGPKTFVQCAGFLRLPGGEHPLDATAIHPESYLLTEGLLKMLDANLEDIGKTEINEKLKNLDLHRTAELLDTGIPTLKDIVENLRKPGRDPREELPTPVFREDILDLDDLKEGMELHGTVINVVDFGAFVDIGLKQSGMIHISQLADNYVKHPMDVVNIGDRVKVRVLSIDKERGRVALSMRQDS
ncbi:transcription accessory protein (s1 rna-binding domain) [hydrocarbon metagenome]|uniref:Transcription accessory protein (S1 rna-binding domain) n=1 Tax=hydrocarbon metagenome TaxID=938273 RepID=A0A0W8E4Z8_9ZZZZ